MQLMTANCNSMIKFTSNDFIMTVLKKLNKALTDKQLDKTRLALKEEQLHFHCIDDC